MVKSKPKVVIDNLAKVQLREAYRYISLDSLKSAEKVKSKILKSIKELADQPEKYSSDKYKLNNDGSYRAFEIYKYRLSYHVSITQITVTRIRHTSMEPKPY
jgi:plasmid stabilization system protein ParE